MGSATTRQLRVRMRLLRELEAEDMPQLLLRKIRKKNFSSQNSNRFLKALPNSDPKSQLTSEVLRG